jgi:prepilin signal peptidase PulO-like enzyme (type II secretory pathway)
MLLSLINFAAVLLSDSYGTSIPGVEWLMLGWLIVVGGCVGSFLNVVVHRLPLGLNVAYPGSRCPQCRHAIRGYDNIPVLSWLVLRGQCRDCKLPISCRYPLVEAGVGLVSGILASVDLFSNWWGWTITASELNPWSSWIPWWRYAGHFVLACTLLSAALMEYDRQAVPRRLFYPVIGLGLLTLWLVPQATDWPFGRDDWSSAGVVRFLMEFAIAILTGLLIAVLREGNVALALSRENSSLRAIRYSLPLAFGAVEIWLGLRALIVALALSVVAWLSYRLLMPHRDHSHGSGSGMSKPAFPFLAAFTALIVAYFFWNL